MAASSAGTHEPYENLSPQTLDIHRALVSLMEELEAIDWYRQRVEVCGDEQLKAILEHNMNEEIEHASMVLEWLRRLVPKMNGSLKTYLFTHGDITKLEKAATGGEGPEQESGTKCRPRPRVTIGALKGRHV
ncbi:encapsulin-associated ferritin-like protein [Nitrospira sp. Nam74]